MTFDEQCEACMAQIEIFLTDIAMGPTPERYAALRRMRELGMKPEHIDTVYGVCERVHAWQLAQAEAHLAERLGEVH